MTFRKGQWLWFDPIYRVNFALICSDPKDFQKRLPQVVPADVVAQIVDNGFTDCTGIQGRCISVLDTPSGLVVVIWIRPCADIPVIAHETLHATACVLAGKDLTLCDKTEEAYTYYMEWILREALTRMLKK